MTQLRKRQISLDDTPVYRCVSRRPRRAFSCGIGEAGLSRDSNNWRRLSPLI